MRAHAQCRLCSNGTFFRLRFVSLLMLDDSHLSAR